MGLVPPHPPGRLTRKARAFQAKIAQLRPQGYTLESIRQALAAAGIHVSLSTVGRSPMDGGAAGGSAVGRPAHWLPPHGRRSPAADVTVAWRSGSHGVDRQHTSSGGSAAGVTPSAANGAMVEPLRALQRIAPRHRAWRVPRVAIWLTAANEAQRNDRRRPVRQAAGCRAAGTNRLRPWAREGRFVASPLPHSRRWYR